MSATHFPTGFGNTSFMLALATGASYLVSEFLTKGIGPCIVVELVSPLGKGGPGASYSTTF